MGLRGRRRAARPRRHFRDARRRGARLTRVVVAALAAAAALIAIGTLEAAESARELAELTSVTRLRPNGAGLTALGIVASAAVYLVLGWWLRDGAAATRAGAAVGLVAGLGGGTLRAMLIADAVRDAIARSAAVPEWFVAAVLAVFVGLSALVSIAAGAALAFAGTRLSRGGRSRPPA
jgi:hypothetical protein